MTDTLLHEQIVQQLLDLAEMVRANPELAAPLRYTFDRILACVSHQDDPKSVMAVFARAGKAADAKVTKSFDSDYAEVQLHFGEHVSLVVFADRKLVCERVITGTREVTKKIPDPAAPLVEVTKTVEDVEWRCLPILEEATS